MSRHRYPRRWRETYQVKAALSALRAFSAACATATFHLADLGARLDSFAASVRANSIDFRKEPPC